MKEQIVRILKENEFGCRNVSGEWIQGVYSEHFDRMADEIVKLLAAPDVTKCALPERKPSVCRHCKSDDIYFDMDAGTWVCNECNQKAN
jgi:hypothetical protein